MNLYKHVFTTPRQPAFPGLPLLRVERPTEGWYELTATAVSLSREFASTCSRWKRRNFFERERGVRLNRSCPKSDSFLENCHTIAQIHKPCTQTCRNQILLTKTVLLPKSEPARLTEPKAQNMEKLKMSAEKLVPLQCSNRPGSLSPKSKTWKKQKRAPKNSFPSSARTGPAH
jgi:hypothetical protein